MARLRKPSAPEPFIIMPPATASKTTRTTRNSPRKTLRESPSTRELRYTSQDNENSLLVPKTPAGGTPVRKQRILRPVASNSRLLRKLSNESLAIPERKERLESRDFGLGLGHSYSRNLARTMAKRAGKGNKGDRKIVVAVEIEEEAEETALDEIEDLDRSLLCGDEEEVVPEEQVEPVQKENEEDEEDEDEDPVVDVKIRRRKLPTQQIFESDTEEEAEDLVVVVKSRDRQVQTQAVELELEPKMLPPLQSLRPPFRKGHSTISNWAQEVIDLTGSSDAPTSFASLPSTRAQTGSFADSSRPTSPTFNDVDAILHFSPTPTKFRSPRKAPPISRPNTPPPPPASPSKLVSPSKKNPRIPDAPALRPSLDAFWAADVVNDWNDRHSPSKPLVSPRKQKWLQSLEKQDNGSSSDSDASFASPTVSPRKNKPQSPTKKGSSDSSPTVTEIRAQRKAFSAQKHALAESFLAEIDTIISNGRITELSRLTGGIKLIWSKTLKTTAGRANWRREQVRIRIGPSPTDLRTESRHHCSIELAEKVIDDEERLYNVLAHEYCHLTTFMISEQRNNPHGAEFKAWGAKVTDAFRHKGVQVTTKHSYKIEYKYVWECVSCGYEYKRHSKSVDPVKHSCGKCKGKLVQTKPVPRGAGKGKAGEPREKNEYQVFIKSNFARVKKELEGKGLDTQMGKVMEAVAREYREAKERKDKLTAAEVELAFEGLNLGGDE